MLVAYNDTDPFVCEWLRNLIRAGHVNEGWVYQKDIRKLKPKHVMDRTFHAFAGIGLWDLALRLAEWPEGVPVWTGSCPCQPFSIAGKRKGDADERHIWPTWKSLIRECHPPVIFGEQVASPDGRSWLSTVRTDLEALGYAVGCSDLCAAGVGAPHIRQRLYFVAYLQGDRRLKNFENSKKDRGANSGGGVGKSNQKRRDRIRIRKGQKRKRVLEASGPSAAHWMGNSSSNGSQKRQRPEERFGAVRIKGDAAPSPSVTTGAWSDVEWWLCQDGKARPSKPKVFPLAYGYSGRVGLLRAYGNAIVPQVATVFIKAFVDILTNEA